MASKNNTLSVILDISRAAVGRATYDRKVPVTMEGLGPLQIVEQKLAAGATGVEVKFGPIVHAAAVFVFTSRPINMHINGLDSPDVKCGSVTALMDTDVQSLHLDNDVDAVPVDTTVEIWLVSLDA